MCDSAATSMEHVPPKCLFPEKKDIGSNSYRNNLITVPSCDVHNSLKSQDDEFLMVGIAGIIGNNSIGYVHHMGKVNRAILKSSNKMLEKVYLTKNHYQINLEDNKFIDVIIGTPDISRLQECFKRIAYGIYLHHFKHRFIGDIKMVLGFLINKERNPDKFKKFVKHRFDLDLQDKPKLGNNKEVFYYQFIDADKDGLIALKLSFYEGVKVFISFIPESSKLPYNLGIDLMNRGIKTQISLEGVDYEFN